MAYPQHQTLIRLPHPPKPPHSHHSSHSGSNHYSGGGNYYYTGGGGSSGGSTGGGDVSSNYPFKASNITAYSSLMFLAVGVFIVRTFHFFRRHCTKLENSKRQEYLTISNTKGVGPNGRFSPYRDNPGALRNRSNNNNSRKQASHHPDLSQVPPQSINTETLQRLQTTGIRMTAHGVHCDPRKVWLSMDENSIIWQSEFQKQVPDLHGNKLVAVRGSLHRINWQMIEYIDVGKRTDALKQATHAADHLCFSLLTPEGSLDLQASSQLERDSLVTCIGSQLDEILGRDWRLLGGTPSSAGVSSASGAYSDSSFSVPDYSVDI